MNLELTTTAELIEEMGRRYPTLLVAGEASRDEERDNNLFIARGDLGSLVALVHTLDMKLTYTYMHNMEPTDDML